MLNELAGQAEMPVASTAEVDYDHGRNLHTVPAARAALQLLLADEKPGSLLDVGCGQGTWLRAALDLGIPEVMGIDGVAVTEADFLCPYRYFRQQNLCEPWDLARRFDLALCLEVAEHLPDEAAPALIAALVEHADAILFSAAAPRQPGQHHVNCQWPEYWQALFNEHGYACTDAVRWQIWDSPDIEPWYRQNLFMAKRAPETAGREDRVRPVLHPAMLEVMAPAIKNLAEIEAGIWPTSWYLSLLCKTAFRKLRRRMARLGARIARSGPRRQGHDFHNTV